MKRSILLSGLVLLASTIAARAQTTVPGGALPTQPVPVQPESIAAPTPVPTPPITAPTMPPLTTPSQPVTEPTGPPLSTGPVVGGPPNPPLQAGPVANASFTDVVVYTVPQRWWFNAEYLLWFIKDTPLPPLVTSGSIQDTFPAALGQPHTQTVLGGPADSGIHNGGRFYGGYWFTDSHIFGMDAGFLFLGSEQKSRQVSSDGSPVLGRPFINALNGQETASAVAYPDFQTGGVRDRVSSQLWVADINLRAALFYQPNFQLSLLGGFRYLYLIESLHTLEDDTYAPNTGVSEARVSDWISTHNNFFGGQLGSCLNWVHNRWSVDAVGKIALGVVNENARLSGASLFTYPDGSATALAYGGLVQPSNSGNYTQNRFAVVPEGTVTLGYAITQHIRFTLGYTFLYVSNVFRPGDQIDRTMNPTEVAAVLANQQIVGPTRPNFTFKSNDFWAQGVNFGLQVRY